MNAAEGTSLVVLLALPFMQRALLAGVLTGALGGLLGSVAVLRQLSFFSDALGHSALLGLTLGVVLGINPTLVLIPFAVIFALLVSRLIERSRLSADAAMAWLIREQRVALVSGSSFGLEGCCLRLSYGMLGADELAEALQRLVAGLESLARS